MLHVPPFRRMVRLTERSFGLACPPCFRNTLAKSLLGRWTPRRASPPHFFGNSALRVDPLPPLLPAHDPSRPPQADTIFDFLRGDEETVGFEAFHEGYKRITDFASDPHHQVAHHVEWYVLPGMPGGGVLQTAMEQGKRLAKPVVERTRAARTGDTEALLEGEPGGVGDESHWWVSASSFLLCS